MSQFKPALGVPPNTTRCHLMRNLFIAQTNADSMVFVLKSCKDGAERTFSKPAAVPAFEMFTILHTESPQFFSYCDGVLSQTAIYEQLALCLSRRGRKETVEPTTRSVVSCSPTREVENTMEESWRFKRRKKKCSSSSEDYVPATKSSSSRGSSPHRQSNSGPVLSSSNSRALFFLALPLVL
eukprot:TRINITY_DN5987_c0_g1_i1.p1 TRINITY_DN5987_c0_g1~~TRINITY_DN5987_c0_g1_i1.p1  ORF type:complete len:190 (+),score=31.25 TRINITY_DN5987_c0_g1_i1:25-570(+)